MFKGTPSTKEQQQQLEESAANKRKRSSFDDDSDSDSSSSDEETFASSSLAFNNHNNLMNDEQVNEQSKASSSSIIDNDQKEDEENTMKLSEFKKTLLSKLSKQYTTIITQNELDILEQQLLSNPFAFSSSEWDELIGQYQYRSYIGQFNHQIDKRNTDLPSQYSVLLNNQYINVNALEKTRHLRWKRSEFLKLGEESWLDWIREEELHFMEGKYSDHQQRDVIKCIYERALLWENYSYKTLRANYCKFMLKYYESNSSIIDDSFNLVFNLVGYDEEICNLYLKYLKQYEKNHSKIRNIYANLLKHPNHQSVFTIWKEYNQWEKNPSDDEMKARYIHALKQVEERISLQKQTQDESSYLEQINFEMKKYNNCKELLKSKEFNEMSLEDLNEIGSILKERITLLLKKVASESNNSETLWNMLLNFLISEKDEFISTNNETLSSSNGIFNTIKTLHEIIKTNFKYLDNSHLSIYLQNIEQVDDNLLNALHLHMTCWVAFKNLSWNSEMHKYLILSLEILHELSSSKLEYSSSYLKLINDIMFNKSMHALNSFANDLTFNDYYQVFSTFCSCLTRLNRKLYFNISTRSEPNENLNSALVEVSQAADQSFQTFSDYLDQYFKMDTSRVHYFELQYAEFLLENGQSQRALEFFENVLMNNEIFKKELRAWQDFIQFMEKINWFEINNENPLETKHEKISATYDLGIRSMDNPSTKQILAKLWLYYEKVNSNSVHSIIKAENILKQFKDSQKKKMKEKSNTKEKSNIKEKSIIKEKSNDDKGKTEKKPKEEKKTKVKEDRPKKKVKFATTEEELVEQVPSENTNIISSEISNVEQQLDHDVEMKELENIKSSTEKTMETKSTSNETNQPQTEPPKKIKKESSDEKPCLNVVVWNLPFSMKEQDIRELFQQHSIQAKRITLITRENGSSKGMAFVELESHEIIQQAIEKLNNYGIDKEGNLLKVAQAETAKMKKLLKKQKDITNKKFVHNSTPKLHIKESDTRQKKPNMFKPRSVPKRNETISSSSSSSGNNNQQTASGSGSDSVVTNNTENQSQPSAAAVGGLSNDDFKKFLR
ncbi:predicted protein [Naegleria gruberi]|uniref:Predicted protein n=1 Tax=Naegleria gruberi TaxID=5762 RepID=D2W2Y5_NAEGR|nr:uncharacterized protein NAEGRDRAFT_75755 [Naegleria gruberi]EFC36598.1 predicted protein [Naegleria gruberi]|eukprot:XP_002669342.1 predicted protein [Naegleria gruberi strain NEG-M]